MKKKYFTVEEKKAARKIESKKYYDKIKKSPLSDEEKEILKIKKIVIRKEYIKDYYIKNRKKILKHSKKYFKENQEERQKKNNENYKKRINEDPAFKLACGIRRSIRNTLKRIGTKNKSRTTEILGCSFEELKRHLESQWEPWMDWDNHGLYDGTESYGWDIDHIIPVSSGVTEEDIIRLNHYTNLQPLCSYINRVVKRDIITIKKENDVSSIYIK